MSVPRFPEQGRFIAKAHVHLEKHGTMLLGEIVSIREVAIQGSASPKQGLSVSQAERSGQSRDVFPKIKILHH